MADKETVIVEKGERRSNGLLGVVIVVSLIILFFAFGGFSMFNGEAETSAPATGTPAPTAPSAAE